MPRRRTQAIQVDSSKPSGALHAFAKEAAANGAVSVLAAYITSDGKVEALRMGRLDALEAAARGIARSIASELGLPESPEDYRERWEAEVRGAMRNAGPGGGAA